MARKVPLALVTQTGEKNNQLDQARVNQKEKAPDMGSDLKEKLKSRPPTPLPWTISLQNFHNICFFLTEM